MVARVGGRQSGLQLQPRELPVYGYRLRRATAERDKCTASFNIHWILIEPAGIFLCSSPSAMLHL